MGDTNGFRRGAFSNGWQIYRLWTDKVWTHCCNSTSTVTLSEQKIKLGLGLRYCLFKSKLYKMLHLINKDVLIFTGVSFLFYTTLHLCSLKGWDWICPYQTNRRWILSSGNGGGVFSFLLNHVFLYIFICIYLFIFIYLFCKDVSQSVWSFKVEFKS